MKRAFVGSICAKGKRNKLLTSRHAAVGIMVMERKQEK